MTLAAEGLPLSQPPVLLSGVQRALATRSISFGLSGLQRQGIRFRLAAEMLKRAGIILIRGAADAKTSSALAASVNTIWAQLRGDGAGGELANAILNLDQIRPVKGYKALVQSTQPVINYRYGEDEGMIDIFHPEDFIPKQREQIIDSLQESLVAALAQRAFGADLEVKCRNLYLSEGVKDTRLFHCDGEKPKVKAFLYLSDVESLGSGPYCYVPRSHNDDELRRRNQAFNSCNNLRKDDYRLLSGRFALPVFCRAGDMVVSAQHGVHCGLPQAATARRMVLVTMFNAR